MKKALLATLFLIVLTVGIILTFKNYLFLSKNKIGEGWLFHINEEFGFSFYYPQEFSISSYGPNISQQALNRGEQVSGTVTPILETIDVKDENDETVVLIQVFNLFWDIKKENYVDEGFLYLNGPCDLRWGFEVKKIKERTIGDVKALTVLGKDAKSNECNYLKLSNGKGVVISNLNNYKKEFFNKIILTLNPLFYQDQGVGF